MLEFTIDFKMIQRYCLLGILIFFYKPLATSTFDDSIDDLSPILAIFIHVLLKNTSLNLKRNHLLNIMMISVLNFWVCKYTFLISCPKLEYFSKYFNNIKLKTYTVVEKIIYFWYLQNARLEWDMVLLLPKNKLLPIICGSRDNHTTLNNCMFLFQGILIKYTEHVSFSYDFIENLIKFERRNTL
ncbi:low-density lipoprotein receptor-related protein 1 [Aphis craccivora]|uniref:Low-density lipoprotein receptor-related protein 1 n=1 Tax=Aphis craccivora TaxID=307492 RepID=A0A6G0YXJ3_APHCR|nr:low-density lipoprotein receptor-related protein 1 [Aphis craccivora]